VSLSSLYQDTGVPMARLSVQYQAAVRSTVSYGSLTSAEQTISRLRSQVSSCGAQWNSLVAWKSQDDAYQARLVAWEANLSLWPG
jgi:hypothetical protein